jgi:type IX secretion system PorP/SprF family membrane protein
MQLLFDRAGSIGWTSTHVLPALNYHKSLSSERNSYLSLGFMGGWIQRRFDPSKATTNSQYDGGGLGENFSKAQYSYLDGSVGMSYNSILGNNENNNFFVGAAYHHFTKPNASLFQPTGFELHPKLVFSGGFHLGVSEFAYLTIQADQSLQGAFRETVAGAMYGLKLGPDPVDPLYTIHAGAFLRWNDALIPVIKLDYQSYSFSLSYDANISKLKPSSYGRGGVELSLSYIAFRKAKGEYMLCPRF